MSANVSTSKWFFPQVRIGRGLILGAIIASALIAFETFNYSTTEYALTDLLGNLRFAGIRWATILSIAFCGIDFAGIARLFTPQIGPMRGSPFHSETWYLFGAWLLAATMNAMLTWWGVSLAVLGRATFGAEVIERTTLLRVVPIFVALLVWLIRVLIIGTFSTSGEKLLAPDALFRTNTVRSQSRPERPRSESIDHVGPDQARSERAQPAFSSRPQAIRPPAQALPANPASVKPGTPQVSVNRPAHNEPTYHPLAASAPRDPRGQARSDPSGTEGSFRH